MLFMIHRKIAIPGRYARDRPGILVSWHIAIRLHHLLQQLYISVGFSNTLFLTQTASFTPSRVLRAGAKRHGSIPCAILEAHLTKLGYSVLDEELPF